MNIVGFSLKSADFRAVITAILLVVLAATADFFLRVSVWRDGDSNSRQIVIPDLLPRREPADVIVDTVERWLTLNLREQKKETVSAEMFGLSGVFVGRQGSRALLAIKGPDGSVIRYVRVSMGEEVEGWKVQDVQSKKIYLQRDGDVVELLLFRARMLPGGGG